MISSFIQDTQDGFYDEKPAVSLNLDLLKYINLDKYPPNRLHFLINALQRGIKPPSECSMRRSQRRNQRKSGVQLEKTLTVKTKIGLKQKFILPNKNGPQPRISPPISRSRGRGRIAKYSRTKPEPTFYIVSRRHPPLLSTGKTGINTRSNRVPKQKIMRFKIRSPKWLLLKAERDRFRQVIQEYRLKSRGYKRGVQKSLDIPLYFRKKKASQQRRRKQKHLLIKNNRDALVKIYGDAIFQRGWPVGRKQIKKALGIKQQTADPSYVGQFLRMSQQKKVERKKIKQNDSSDSSMDIIGSYRKDQRQRLCICSGLTNVEKQKAKRVFIDEDDFPSLLSPKTTQKPKNTKLQVDNRQEKTRKGR